MQGEIKLTMKEIHGIIIAHIQEKLGTSVDTTLIKIETKSSQNFKSEWELAEIRASYIFEI